MNSFFQLLKHNWKSGLTVSLVSIPLSVSLAVASGTTPVAGIITAIWAGLLASIFGGSNYNIVGPTGALSGILLAYAITNGASALGMLAIVAGVFILISYVFKLERYVVLIPGSTVHGFTLGVAFIIALNQLDFALGLTGIPKTAHFIENVFRSLSHSGEASLVAVILFALFFVLLFISARLIKKIPAILLLSPIGILVGYLSSAGYIGYAIQTLGQKFPNMNGALFVKPDFFFNGSLIVPALAVAVVAILETMISAKIADVATKTKYNRRRELLGLGIANIGSGLMGGIPATAALARTAVNVKSRATHRMSQGVSSISIAIISFFLLRYFSYIPLPVIAAILVFAAVRMVEREHFVRMYKNDRRSFILALVVAGVTVYQDPIIGIVFGSALALLLLVEKLSKGQFEIFFNKDKKIVAHHVGETLEEFSGECDTLVYSIKGQLAYINAESHLARFEDKLSHYKTVVLRLRELYYIDMEGVETLNEIIEKLEGAGKTVLISGVNRLIEKEIMTSHLVVRLKNENRVFNHTHDALQSLGFE